VLCYSREAKSTSCTRLQWRTNMDKNRMCTSHSGSSTSPTSPRRVIFDEIPKKPSISCLRGPVRLVLFTGCNVYIPVFSHNVCSPFLVFTCTKYLCRLYMCTTGSLHSWCKYCNPELNLWRLIFLSCRKTFVCVEVHREEKYGLLDCWKYL
jgi:hypothetical protein